MILLICLLVCSSIEATTTVIEETALGIIEKTSPSSNTTVLKDQFANLIHSNEVFVDKTMLIKELLEHEDKIILITRPRKWGKTINLEMMKSFLEIQFENDTNTIVRTEETANYKLFKNGELAYIDGSLLKLKYPLMISKQVKFLDEHLVRYPVIHVSFKTWKGISYDKIIESFRNLMSDIFKHHNYLEKILRKKINDEGNTVEQKNKVSKELDIFAKIVERKSSPLEAIEGISFLSRLLHEHLGKLVIVLIDDYEYPLIEAILESKLTFKEQDKTKFIEFYHDFLEKSFKTNVHVRKVVLTGVLRLVKEDRFHNSTGGVPKHGGIDERFFQFYGFTKREVDLLVVHDGISEFFGMRVHHIYNGYETRKPSWQMYNPYSIMKFYYADELGGYWMATDSVNGEKSKVSVFHLNASEIMKILPLRVDMDSLMRTEEASIDDADLHFHAEDFIKFNNLLAKLNVRIKSTDISDNDKEVQMMYQIQQMLPTDTANLLANLALSYFWAHGYLTYSHVNSSKLVTALDLKHSSADKNLVWYRLSNYEIRNQTGLEKGFYTYYYGPYDGDDIMNHQENFDDPILLHLLRYVHDDGNSVMKKALEFMYAVCTKYGFLNGIDIIYYLLTDCDYVGTFFKFFRSRIAHHPDIVLYKEERIVVIKTSFKEQSADAALQVVKKYEQTLIKSNITGKIKFIGINGGRVWHMCHYTLCRVSQGWFNINGDDALNCVTY